MVHRSYRQCPLTAGQTNYCASKGGLLAFSRAMAAELAPKGIRVNAVVPGFVETEMTARMPRQVNREAKERILLQRFGTPEGVAEVVAFRISDAAAYIVGQSIVNCLEITATDWTNKLSMLKNFLKGGPIRCMRLSGRFTKAALEEINDALSRAPVVPSSCASFSMSCASELVRRLGRSDKHAVMAAGFAGGIGLSGGACGVLGAAIWINEMLRGRDKDSYAEVNARAGELIDVFLACTDYTFECREIVGREFDDMDDHARHVQNGGCSDIIEALAGHIGAGAQRREQAV